MLRQVKRGCKKKNFLSVAVIGAGFSGLVSALLLARSGLKVTLIERNGRVAPLLNNYSYEGFQVNNGFHYLGGYFPGSALYNCFEELGINDKLTPISINDNGFDRFSGITGEDIVIPVGLHRARSVLERIFPGSRKVLAEYFRLIETTFTEFDFSKAEEYFYKVTPALTGTSLSDFLQKWNAEDHLVDFLNNYTQLLLGLDAREVPLLSHVLGIGAYFYAANTFRGSGGALIEALEEQVRASGVRILTGTEVVKLFAEPRRRFAGLRIRSINDDTETTLTPDACIATIHPKRLLKLLPDSSSANLYSNRISGYHDTRSVFLFHLAVDADAAKQHTDNHHKYDRSAAGELLHRVTLLPDFSNPGGSSEAERQMTVMFTAWNNDVKNGCPERLNGMCTGAHRLPAGKFGRVKAKYIDNIRKSMVDRLESSFPGLKGKYRIINTVSPCHFDRINATWDGSIYGVKCSLDRIGLSTIGPMKGLFLAGQSITAPGIFGTLVSAYLASNRITGYSS